ncbi:hypothetical protein [Pleomorphochaeta sp. DL1XJH-081]|uniref:hypothetical protein n=1 Tax=Pleomorphochaeta sp. DL1XJH-081 TaxID=3409690 RepID=UPI003BB62D49
MQINNPFSTTKNYGEMLRKIACYSTVVVFILLTILRSILNDTDIINNQIFQKWLNVKITVYSIQLSVIDVTLAIFVGVITRVIKLHDRLSTLLRIRKRFDIQQILKPIIKECSPENYPEKKQGKAIIENRHKLMRKTFYKYASGNPEYQHIDPHLIEMALDQWTYFWILEEAIFFITIASIPLIIYKKYFALAIFVLIIILLIVIMKASYQKSKIYAKDEVEEIISDINRKKEICKAINEILN